MLHGAELNIGPDGTVDYDPAFVAAFDWTVASVHSAFDLDVPAQTAGWSPPSATRRCTPSDT